MADLLWSEEEELPPPISEAPESELQRIVSIGDLSYAEFLSTYFASTTSKPLGERHRRLWKWGSSLRTGRRPRPRIDPWPRGSGKSTTAELLVTFLGCRLTRRFAVFVCATQAKANERVQSVAEHFDTLGIGRAVNRYGSSKGWKQDRLRTSHGFNVAGVGLDVPMRGMKFGDQRPDFIIIDDVDDELDTPQAVRKKIAKLTKAIIPSGSQDCAILVIQNLIHSGGVVCQLYDGRAKFLLNREVIDLEPAVRGLKTELVPNEAGLNVYRIVEGEATWPEGQSIEDCEALINDITLDAFLTECQHEVYGGGGFVFDRSKFRYVDWQQLPRLVRIVRAWDLAATQGGGDYTVGVLMGIAANGQLFVLDVKRQQFSPEKVEELIKETAEQDARGEVWESDEYDRAGRLVRKGRLLYRFADYKDAFGRIVEPCPLPFPFKGEVTIHLPQDPSQAGSHQKRVYLKLLAGYKVKARKVNGKKAHRAKGYAGMVNAGNVHLVRADWNHDYTYELGEFREDETHEYDDQVDPSADAHNELVREKKEARTHRN